MTKREAERMMAGTGRWSRKYGYKVEATNMLERPYNQAKGYDYGVNLHDLIDGGQNIEWDYLGLAYWHELSLDRVALLESLDAQGNTISAH